MNTVMVRALLHGLRDTAENLSADEIRDIAKVILEEVNEGDKLMQEQEKVLNRLRTALNSETEDKIQILDEVKKLRDKVPRLFYSLQLMVELTRRHLIDADNYGTVRKAKELLLEE